jgi:hypothetical protein
MSVYLINVHLTGMHLMSVHLTGVHLMGEYLTGVHLILRSRLDYCPTCHGLFGAMISRIAIPRMRLLVGRIL